MRSTPEPVSGRLTVALLCLGVVCRQKTALVGSGLFRRLDGDHVTRLSHYSGPAKDTPTPAATCGPRGLHWCPHVTACPPRKEAARRCRASFRATEPCPAGCPVE